MSGFSRTLIPHRTLGRTEQSVSAIGVGGWHLGLLAVSESLSLDADGAHAALVDARQAGKLRFIGFTGHKDPHVHLHMIDVAREHGFTFDAVQMPLDVMDAHYRSFERMVVPELVRQHIAILGMLAKTAPVATNREFELSKRRRSSMPPLHTRNGSGSNASGCGSSCHSEAHDDQRGARRIR